MAFVALYLGIDEVRMEDRSGNAHQRAATVKMLIVDCDGVLTDGRVIILPNGEETKAFDEKDGHAVRMAQRAGLAVAIISGRESFALAARAKELGVVHLRQRVKLKLDTVSEILAEEGLTNDEICYVGDDVNDIPVLRRVGLAVAVADASEDTKQFAHLLTSSRGGRGAVREVIEFILRTQNRWSDALSWYLR